MIKNILFDLDGTLLPMDQEKFTKAYFSILVQTISPLGYEPNQFIQSLWKGIKAMIENDGSCSNEEKFWKVFTSIYGNDVLKDKPFFDSFYKKEFQQVATSCGYTEEAAKLIEKLKKRSNRLILATNPIFPSIATESRIRWAGLKKEDFDFITTYENSSYCKPNLAYYEEIIKKMNLKAEECLMVGNDVDEDMIAKKINMSVFLLTDCLINKSKKNYDSIPHGDFKDLFTFLDHLPDSF